MYDINRSNLLSIETMKMYLYDLAILGNANANIKAQIERIFLDKKRLGQKRKFNNSEYKSRYKSDSNKGMVYFWSVIMTMFVIGVVWLVIPWIFLSDEEYREFLAKEPPISPLLFLTFIFIIVPIIAVKVRKYKIEEYNKAVWSDEQRAHARFEEYEKRRLEQENEEIVELERKMRKLQEKLNKIEAAIQCQFDMEILHSSYRDVRVCGIMFQLFDTGRVYNLTEAMNLYEDLKWKAEMKAMLQALLDKVDDLLSVQKNIEYYSRCMVDNQMETNRLLRDVSINQQRIQSNQEAINMNMCVISRNTDTMRMLAEFDFIQKNR